MVLSGTLFAGCVYVIVPGFKEGVDVCSWLSLQLGRVCVGEGFLEGVPVCQSEVFSEVSGNHDWVCRYRAMVGR